MKGRRKKINAPVVKEISVKYEPPQRIKFPSDGNTLELTNTLPVSKLRKEPVYEYTYLLSTTKKEKVLPLLRSSIEGLIARGMIKVN